LAAILWVVLRTGKRQSRLCMRRLAHQAGGIYSHGGMFAKSYVTIHRGSASMMFSLRPRSAMGGPVEARFNAPWPGRPSIEIVGLRRLCDRATGDSGARNGGNAATIEFSQSVAATAARLDALPVKHFALRGNAGGFELSSELAQASPTLVIHWSEIVIRLYELLLAESEPGVQFEGISTGEIGADVCCQVCGTSPTPQETVLCDRCGAPHHAECWEYNGGCAIFGCREQSRR
jgi:hypothetical protein